MPCWLRAAIPVTQRPSSHSASSGPLRVSLPWPLVVFLSVRCPLRFMEHYSVPNPLSLCNFWATRRLPDRPVGALYPRAPISPQGAPMAPRRLPIQMITRRPPGHSAPAQLIGDLLVAKHFPAISVSSWLFHSLMFRCSVGEASGLILSE